MAGETTQTLDVAPMPACIGVLLLLYVLDAPCVASIWALCASTSFMSLRVASMLFLVWFLLPKRNCLV